MALLATFGNYQLSYMKRTTQSVLLSAMQVSKHNTFRNSSTNDNSNSIKSIEQMYSLDMPPEKPNVGICCESGCDSCVWLRYVRAVRVYYGNDREKLQNALNSIPDSDIKAFVEMELKKCVKLDV